MQEKIIQKRICNTYVHVRCLLLVSNVNKNEFMNWLFYFKTGELVLCAVYFYLTFQENLCIRAYVSGKNREQVRR